MARVGRRDRLAESEVRGQHLDRGRELGAAKSQYLARRIGGDAQLDADLALRFRPRLDCNSDDRGR